MFAESQIERASFEPAFVIRAVTVVDVPFQLARIEQGSGGSENVYVAVSPAFRRPTVPPVLFAGWSRTPSAPCCPP